jgi:hypothetical protein
MHVYIADLNIKRLLPIRNIDSRPSGFRINYTCNLYGFRILLFGGLNENLKAQNILETFDISTYRWEKIVTKGNT